MHSIPLLQVYFEQFTEWFNSIHHLEKSDCQWIWETYRVRAETNKSSFPLCVLATVAWTLKQLMHCLLHSWRFNCYILIFYWPTSALWYCRNLQNNMLSNISGSLNIPPNVTLWSANLLFFTFSEMFPHIFIIVEIKIYFLTSSFLQL